MAKESQVKSKRKVLNPVFHLQTKQEDDSQLTKGMIKVVRKTGQLNLSGRSLATVPERLFTIYDFDKEEAMVHYDFNKPQNEDAWWDFKPLTYLDLSSNVLQEIPGKIQMFEDLIVLNLQDNSLTTLPSEIGVLTKLTKLNLSHNKINVLPKELSKLTELQNLNLSHNCLESLIQEISDLVMLQQLDLSYNSLTAVLPGIGYLVRLTDLNFAHNKLTEIPPDVVNIRALLKLDVTHNNLTLLPKLSELRKLQFLYAQHNDITNLPDLEGCENLQQLYFGNNFIKEVTKEFCESVPHLKILELRDNKIESLPDEIAMLYHIVRLDLTNNELSTLPDTLGLLPHLQNLQIEGNKLKQIRSDIIKGGTTRILKHLRERFESEGNKPKPLPTNTSSLDACIFPDRYVLKSSKMLNLQMKQLTHVPENVFEDAVIAEVTAVDLCKNKLTEVPFGLKRVGSSITELNICLNQIKCIPEFVSEFSRLQYMDVSNNLLNDLPEALADLKNLRELVISNNRFSMIPVCVYEMEALEILLAKDNQITEIDVNGLQKLRKIATLDLSNNNIGHVPPELGNVNQLRNLELRGNSFRQPRYQILEQGTESILCYLRDRIPH